MDQNKTIILAVLGGIAIVLILVLYGLFSGGTEETDPRVTLETDLDFWAVEDEKVAYQSAIDSFNAIYPNVQINYRRFNSIESYERILLDSLAAGEGPDIFVVRNNDLARKTNKISVLPSSKYSLSNLRNQFPDIVEDNFAFDGQNIYGLPLSVDTLSLIYNKDIFASNQIVFAPETWDEFIEVINKTTEYDESRNITQAGAAIGTANNIEYSKDILSLIMIQSGASMVNDTYNSTSFSSDSRFSPLEFYTDFSRSNSEAYTWSSSMGNDFQEFRNSNVGMIFGYSSDFNQTKRQNPSLNLEVAPTPQFSNSNRDISYANYWGYTVSRQSDYPYVAWDFILNMVSNSSQAQNYLNITNKPPALLSLIQSSLNDSDMEVYASQILTAESWPEPDPERVTEIFNNMITTALSDNSLIQTLRAGENQVRSLMLEL